MGETYLARPSAAGHVTVARAAGALWALDAMADAPVPAWVALPPGAVVHDVLGHPTRPLIAVVEEQDAEGGAQRVRVLTADGPEGGAVVHRAAGAVRLCGWWADDVLLLTHGTGAGHRPAQLLLCPIADTPGPAAEATRHTAPTGIAWADHASDGRIVMTSFGPRPVAWAGHRGGGAGRVMVHDPATGSTRWLPGTGNAADAVVLGDRVYWLDDLCGPVDVYTLPIDAGPEERPRRVTHLTGVGATSLRRGPGHLILGSLGRAWSLLPAEDGRLAEPIEIPTGEGVVVPAGHRRRVSRPAAPAVDRVVIAPNGPVAVVGEGRVRTLDGEWSTRRASGQGWIVDAAWDGAGGLLTLEHHDDRLLVVGPSPADPVWTVALGAAAAGADALTHAGGTTVVAGERLGVHVHASNAGPRRIDPDAAHRRSRPVVSPDGAHVAWTEEIDLQGGRLVLHDVRSAATAVLAPAGVHLTGPVFTADGGLVLLARPVSAIAGTAVPLEPGRVLGVDPGLLLTEEGAPAVRELWRAPVPLHELALVDGRPWARLAGGRWRPVHGPADVTGLAGAPVPGSSAPATQTDTGALQILERGGRTRTLTPPAAGPDPLRATAEIIRQVRAVRASLAGDASADTGWEEQVRAAARHVQDDADLVDVLTAAVGRTGISHSAVLGPGTPLTPDPAEALTRRMAAQLPPEASTVVLRDVSVRGWGQVMHLIRTWRGTGPLVLDLRFNEGGQFADALAAVLLPFLRRSATAAPGDGAAHPLLTGPCTTAVLIGEGTGSGGEHLAALLQGLPGVTLWGRRTAGAGTGFHRTRSIGGGLRIALPQYRLGGGRRDLIENTGVVPDVEVPGDHLAGDGFDDHLLELVAHSFPGTANVDPTTRKEREDDRLIAARSR
ncbi:S41 family peptidase [Micrococcus luteus]|uniref:S41 family peptidase n=2 Tax=Actinomycetes TaxID=1760 RepID=UPI0029E99AE1|nr:S41 family peptidase [Micrococcus luteus]MCV7726144.1 S41 family peptidase [Micrococcus luteus]MCV7738650.1 S41 family peptidase [Micrococcus luteus]